MTAWRPIFKERSKFKGSPRSVCKHVYLFQSKSSRRCGGFINWSSCTLYSKSRSAVCTSKSTAVTLEHMFDAHSGKKTSPSSLRPMLQLDLDMSAGGRYSTLSALCDSIPHPNFNPILYAGTWVTP